MFLFFTTSLFSLLWLFNAFFAKNFDQVNLIPTFVITPLTYLWGVFYPISALPFFWMSISMINPIYYMINGFRYGFLWITEVNPFISLGAIIAFNIGLFTLNLWMFKNWKGLKN
jgi:ABC-2 type transport system permease protein